MKLIHLSDLHIGKRVNGFSMIEDQKYILNQILEIIEKQQPDGVILAGDIYDKTIPSAEAVEVFDDFLAALARRELAVFMISGNHDSAERLSFASRILKSSRIYISPVYDGSAPKITMTDPWGKVNFFLLPFVKPAQVKRFFPEDEIETYTEAAAAAIKQMEPDETERNILVTHQFVTGASRCESEELSAGGADNVDARVFDAFDYVALGHLHGPQSAGRETLRYCGTPLKYSFSEARHKKSVTILELEEKGRVTIRTEALIPLRDMKKIRGTYMEVTGKEFYRDLNTQDYYHITLTDEEDIPDAIGRLRSIYPNIMRLEYDNKRTRGSGRILLEQQAETSSPEELFADFYRKQNSQDMTKEQQALVTELIQSIWEEEE